MPKDMHHLLEEAYGLHPRTIDLISDHGEGKVYRVQTQTECFVLKRLASFIEHPEREGSLTDFLLQYGIAVPRMHRTLDAAWIATDEKGIRYQLLSYVEGEVLDINTAPDWFLWQSAATLGRIHAVLADYPPLPTAYPNAFFSRDMIREARDSYTQTLEKATAAGDGEVAQDVADRIHALEKLSAIRLNLDELSVGNAHGDYWIGQIVHHQGQLTVLDWTDAMRVPLCWEIIMSYTYADPACADGHIDPERLERYIRAYLPHHPLTRQDLAAMPYFYLYWIGVLNFYEPYPGLPDEYLRIAKLCTRLLRWLLVHGDALSDRLQGILDSN